MSVNAVEVAVLVENGAAGAVEIVGGVVQEIYTVLILMASTIGQMLII